MIVPGYWFLLGFSLLGAGELFGVYMTNYILSCSSKARTRSNMGFASLTMLPTAPAGAILGALSDYFGSAYTRVWISPELRGRAGLYGIGDPVDSLPARPPGATGGT